MGVGKRRRTRDGHLDKWEQSLLHWYNPPLVSRDPCQDGQSLGKGKGHECNHVEVRVTGHSAESFSDPRDCQTIHTRLRHVTKTSLGLPHAIRWTQRCPGLHGQSWLRAQREAPPGGPALSSAHHLQGVGVGRACPQVRLFHSRPRLHTSTAPSLLQTSRRHDPCHHPGVTSGQE